MYEVASGSFKSVVILKVSGRYSVLTQVLGVSGISECRTVTSFVVRMLLAKCSATYTYATCTTVRTPPNLLAPQVGNYFNSFRLDRLRVHMLPMLISEFFTYLYAIKNHYVGHTFVSVGQHTRSKKLVYSTLQETIFRQCVIILPVLRHDVCARV